MPIRSNDGGFDDYRKERKRQQAKTPLGASALGYDNKALRELEQVEAREVRDQQLTREVHDFFAHATRQAADIVERVARDAQEQAGVRIEQQMESFLIDALARMNSFVVTVLNQRRGPVAEARIEPRVGNLVGDSLDEFRWEGTADVGDKHIGQDPFDTDVEAVRRQFRAEIQAAGGSATPPSVPIEEHLVAATQDDTDESGTTDESAEQPVAAPAAKAEDLPPSVKAQTARVTAAPSPLTAPSPAAELERFKAALKQLVLQGTMTRDEARAAWQTRLRSVTKPD